MVFLHPAVPNYCFNCHHGLLPRHKRRKGGRPDHYVRPAQVRRQGNGDFCAGDITATPGTTGGRHQYEWSDWRVVLPLCLFAALFSLFIWHQRCLGERATVPLHIFQRRNVLFGFVFSFCNNGSLSIIEYYVRIAKQGNWIRLTLSQMPTYFQAVKRFSAFMSGVMVLPTAAGLVVSVPLAGYLTSLTGYYSPFMLLTSLITPPVTGLLTTLDAASRGLEVCILSSASRGWGRYWFSRPASRCAGDTLRLGFAHRRRHHPACPGTWPSDRPCRSANHLRF